MAVYTVQCTLPIVARNAGFTRPCKKSVGERLRPARGDSRLPVHWVSFLSNRRETKKMSIWVLPFPSRAYRLSTSTRHLPTAAVETPIRKVSDGEGIPRCALHRSRHEGSGVG